MQNKFNTLQIFENFIQKSNIPFNTLIGTETDKTFGNFLSIAGKVVPIYVTADDMTGLCSFIALVEKDVDMSKKDEIINLLNELNENDLLFKFFLNKEESIQAQYNCPIIREESAEQIITFVLNILGIALENSIPEITKLLES